MLSIIKQMSLLENNLQSRFIIQQGTVVATSATTKDVAVPAIELTSVVQFSLNTVGGTILGAPYEFTRTAGTGFGFRAGAADTSTYNYIVWNQ